jgi:hypothetical protein
VRLHRVDDDQLVGQRVFLSFRNFISICVLGKVNLPEKLLLQPQIDYTPVNVVSSDAMQLITV